jgi:hypothetical protein
MTRCVVVRLSSSVPEIAEEEALAISTTVKVCKQPKKKKKGKNALHFLSPLVDLKQSLWNVFCQFGLGISN